MFKHIQPLKLIKTAAYKMLNEYILLYVGHQSPPEVHTSIYIPVKLSATFPLGPKVQKRRGFVQYDVSKV